ncbi:MAG: alkaline phosphatase D family protein [Candidatus Cyclobacteriaceae bacterium M3_2C_046]
MLFTQCKPDLEETSEGPYFGNGFRNGWADQHSVVIWTRLTQQPEMNFSGQNWIMPPDSIHRQLAQSNNASEILQAQIPEGYSLKDMEGACPGTSGEVKLSYFPKGNQPQKVETNWHPVDSTQDFTHQWRLDNLKPNATYTVILSARKGENQAVSDTFEGEFNTAPAPDTKKAIDFCVVTCHDYLRKDDSLGHQIYPVMLDLQPDFYVHTGDVEYYDKPAPFGLTEDLMRFHWNRLFALPYQRDFYSQVTTYFMKDDHDVLRNDAYPGMTYGTVDFERGLEIFDQEQFPSNDKPFKTIRWGKDLQIWLVEGRNYRSKNTAPDGPEKTIWGAEQKEWFFETVKASDATFKVLISSTPILGPDRENKSDNYSNSNFQHEGDEIRQFIDQQDNMFICNGDRHWQYVSHPAGTDLWEFSCGAGADQHAGGWSQENYKEDHKFLRVKGGFLKVSVDFQDNIPVIRFQHHDTNGEVVHEEIFEASPVEA